MWRDDYTHIYAIIRSVREFTYERDQRNELSEDREPLCVHSVGNEAGEHSWWYLSFLGALATRLAKAEKSRLTVRVEKNCQKRQAIDRQTDLDRK